MSQRNKALRIHHKNRMKNRIKKNQVNYMQQLLPSSTQVWEDIHHKKHIGFSSWEDVEAWNEKVCVKNADTRKPCSCHMCGNPRKWEKQKKTRQEKVFETKAKIAIHDMGY